MSTDTLNLIGFGAIIDFMSSVLAETKAIINVILLF